MAGGMKEGGREGRKRARKGKGRQAGRRAGRQAGAEIGLSRPSHPQQGLQGRLWGCSRQRTAIGRLRAHSSSLLHAAGIPTPCKAYMAPTHTDLHTHDSFEDIRSKYLPNQGQTISDSCGMCIVGRRYQSLHCLLVAEVWTQRQHHGRLAFACVARRPPSSWGPQTPHTPPPPPPYLPLSLFTCLRASLSTAQ